MKLDSMWCSCCNAKKVSFFYEGKEKCNFCGSEKTVIIVEHSNDFKVVDNTDRNEHEEQPMSKHIKGLYQGATKYNTKEDFINSVKERSKR